MYATMAHTKKVVMVFLVISVLHLLTVSAEETNSATTLQESLNIISSELKSMKTKYEEQQIILQSTVNKLQSTVRETNTRVNELQHQLTEHRLGVGHQLEDIKRVMMEDHTMLKTNSLNIFNKMVDVLVEIRIQHRFQKDIKDEVENLSENLESLFTNKPCIGDIDQEKPCPECFDERISSKTHTKLPEPTESHTILQDVETLAPSPPVTQAPDQLTLLRASPLAPLRAPPLAPPSPRNAPPLQFPTQQPEAMTTTIQQITEEKIKDCASPFFRLVSTGECMVVSVSKRTWKDAQASCLNIGAYLAVPDDPLVLHAYMRKAGARSYYYVGAHNKLGDFRWLNGTLVDSRYWRPHSPSSSYPRRLCVAYSYNGSGSRLFWANKATVCDTGIRYNFICEKS